MQDAIQVHAGLPSQKHSIIRKNGHAEPAIQVLLLLTIERRAGMVFSFSLMLGSIASLDQHVDTEKRARAAKTLNDKTGRDRIDRAEKAADFRIGPFAIVTV